MSEANVGSDTRCSLLRFVTLTWFTMLLGGLAGYRGSEQTVEVERSPCIDEIEVEPVSDELES